MPPVTTNLDQDDINIIDHLAGDEDMSRSAFLRRAILVYLCGTGKDGDHDRG